MTDKELEEVKKKLLKTTDSDKLDELTNNLGNDWKEKVNNLVKLYRDKEVAEHLRKYCVYDEKEYDWGMDSQALRGRKNQKESEEKQKNDEPIHFYCPILEKNDDKEIENGTCIKVQGCVNNPDHFEEVKKWIKKYNDNYVEICKKCKRNMHLVIKDDKRK